MTVYTGLPGRDLRFERQGRHFAGDGILIVDCTIGRTIALMYLGRSTVLRDSETR